MSLLNVISIDQSDILRRPKLHTGSPKMETCDVRYVNTKSAGRRYRAASDRALADLLEGLRAVDSQDHCMVVGQ